MLVSVIIPSYQQPQFLRAAIRSVAAQSYADLEIIVVDDHSRDASLAVALEESARDDRIRVIRRDVNGGLGRARNTGIVHASGEMMAFLDADDCLFPDSISTRVAAFRELSADDPSCVGVFGDWQHTTEWVDLPEPRAPRTEVDDVRTETFHGENGFICSAPIVTSDAVRRVGGFPEGLPLFEDFACWSRIIADGGVFRYVPVMASTYRQRAQSMLRRSDVIGATYARTVIDDLESRGVLLGGRGMIRSAGAGESPRTAQRLAWLRSTQFDQSRRDLGAAHALLARIDEAEQSVHDRTTIPAMMDRTPGDLDDAASDCREVVYSREVPPASEHDVVLVPKTLEDAFEVAAIVRGRRADDHIAPIVALASDTSLERVWPIAELGLPIPNAEDAASNLDENSRWVLFGDDLSDRGDLIRRLGKSRCAIRCTGWTSLRPFASNAARHFRSADLVIARSRLEAAELGDRRVELVPSGVRCGVGLDDDVEAPNRTVLVYLPSPMVDSAAGDAWVATVLRAVGELDVEAALVVASSRDLAATEFRAIAPDLSVFETTTVVVLPVCNDVTLFEGMGLPTVVFDPSPRNDVSTTWLEHLRPARDSAELRRRLTGSLETPAAIDDFASDIGRCAPFTGSDREFARAIVTVMGDTP